MNSPERIPQLEVRTDTTVTERGTLESKICVLKDGPNVVKEIVFSILRDSASGEVKKSELRGRSFPIRSDGVDRFKPERTWHCENEEVSKVRTFLNNHLPKDGPYQLIRAGSEFADLLEQIKTEGVEIELLAALVESAGNSAAFVEALAASDHGQLIAEAVEMQRRKTHLGAFKQAMEDPASSEGDLHRVLKDNPWIFGGRYLGEAVRRELTTGDILDIPLLRGDGSLQVVELKRAKITKLVVPHRSHYIVGPEVHEAVCQAENYLRSLDEERYAVLTKYGVECRRSSATVVIGHSKFVEWANAAQVAEAIRTYNSHLSRVEVITFDQLLASARQALAFSVSTGTTRDEQVQIGEDALDDQLF